jgi:hypothetical protein
MTELEQLRKEVNELRERVAKLEAAAQMATSAPMRLDWTNPAQPTWISQVAQHFPPGTILC